MATPKLSDIVRGDTKPLKFEFKDAAGAAVDITGWKLTFTLKTIDDPTADDSAALIQVSSTAGDDAADLPLSGLMYLTLSSEDTKVDLGSYEYDIQRLIAGTPPLIKTLRRAKIKVVKEITKSAT